MEYTFDAAKDAENIRKHHISLRRASELDSSMAMVDVDERANYGEVRLNAIGFVGAGLYALTFTMHGDTLRAISLRKANRQERADYTGSMVNTEPEYGTPDEENPEWTRERMAKAMRYPNLPPNLMRLIEADKKRGPQKAPKKQAISIRLSPDVLQALRATGPGWQARVDDALRENFIRK